MAISFFQKNHAKKDAGEKWPNEPKGRIFENLKSHYVGFLKT